LRQHKNATKYRHRIRPKVNLEQLLKETSKMKDAVFLASVVNGRDAKLRKKGPSFCFAVVRCFNSIEVPSSRGGRSEAQHNAPRQGSAMPTFGVPDHSCAEQKKRAKLKLSFYFCRV
jgi:hypothetical protein